MTSTSDLITACSFVSSAKIVTNLLTTSGKSLMYEGCQESSWTHMITASNVPDFDIHYYFSLK